MSEKEAATRADDRKIRSNHIKRVDVRVSPLLAPKVQEILIG